MTKRILDGFRKAALITCDSAATRDELLKYSVVPHHRLTVVRNGVHPSCSIDPDPLGDAQAERLLGPISDGAIEILHVGSVIKRKRIDTLLEVFALVVKEFPQARLVRVGGQFTAEQVKMIEKLGISRSIKVLPFIDREVLAAVYRRAALVLQPSESEGFGLPVDEEAPAWIVTHEHNQSLSHRASRGNRHAIWPVEPCSQWGNLRRCQP